MFGYCCKCNEGNPQYYGGGSGGSGSGGGLYFNPYGVGGGCEICPTVPYAFIADIELDILCPCTTLGGTFTLNHTGATTTSVPLPVGAGVCDTWASSEKAYNMDTCVLSTTRARVELVLYSYLGNYNWRLAFCYTRGFGNHFAIDDIGLTDCFQEGTFSSWTKDSPSFPCDVITGSIAPA